MTDKLNCPFCGEKLQTHTMTPGRILICVNKGCPVDSVVMKRIVWQALIDGKKAQDALNPIKEYYVIVRGYGKEQHYISYSTGADWFWNWDLDHAEPFDTVHDAKAQIRAAKIPHARVIKVHRLTTITEQEE